MVSGHHELLIGIATKTVG